MHICLICTEIFAWGKYGGFGRSTRIIGRELVKRGVQVTVLVPRRNEQMEFETLDGMTVVGFDLRRPLRMLQLIKMTEADIYHSEEPSLISFFTKLIHSQKKHLVTFQDTRLANDWWIEYKYPSLSKLQVILNFLYEDNFLVHWLVKHSDRNFSAANMLIPKAIKKYKLKQTPMFLPTPVAIPTTVVKAEKPTVLYLARWDRRKRPELAIQLAAKFPDVEFIMLGTSRDKEYREQLLRSMEGLSNIIRPGFINQFEGDQMDKILQKSWILVNTAAREGLPNAFFECCAYQMAILSSVDSDGFSSKFGYYVSDDDFEKGLNYLLQDDRWKTNGMAGYKYVNDTFRTEITIDEHIKIYNELLGI